MPGSVDFEGKNPASQQEQGFPKLSTFFAPDVNISGLLFSLPEDIFVAAPSDNRHEALRKHTRNFH